MAPTIRVHATLAEDGSLSGKVTAHAAYGPGDPAVEGSAPACSTDITLDELDEHVGEMLRSSLEVALRDIKAAATARLIERLAAATHDSRRVAIQQGEIKR